MHFKNSHLKMRVHRFSLGAAITADLVAAALALLIFMGTEPLTWDEILYMQSSYVGLQDGMILLRVFHTGLLSFFMKLIPDPLLATRVFWAVLAFVTLGLPIAYAYRSLEPAIKPRLVFALFYAAVAFSAEFFWWTPGLAYPDYTVAALMAVMLWVCLTHSPELPRTYSWVGLLLVFAFSAKETGLVLAPCVLLLIQRMPAGGLNRRMVQTMLQHAFYGSAAAFVLLLLVAYFVLGVSFERLPAMIGEWRTLNFGRTQLDNSTFMAWGFRAENPGFFVCILVLIIVAMLKRDRTLAALGAVALSIIALLSFANVYSTATISGRYLMPLLPVVGFMVAHAISMDRKFVDDRITTALIGFGAVVLFLSARWPMPVVPRTTILLNSALIILLGCGLVAVFRPRWARGIAVACLLVLCLAPNTASFFTGVAGINKSLAGRRFADLRNLSVEVSSANDGGAVYFHPSFYKDLQLERGQWPLGAMLNFYSRKPIFPQRVIKPEIGLSASPRYVFANIGETLPAEWRLLARSGNSALYSRGD